MRLNLGILWMACVTVALARPLVEVSGQQPASSQATGSAVQAKASATDPLSPGKWLTTSDERRNRSFEAMKQIAAKSKAYIEPIQSRHVTLWALKDNQRTYLADIEKVEKFFRTKCPEPIRSGLDKRSAHIVLLKDHAEYEAWLRAMFDESRLGDSYFREEAFKRPAYYSSEFVSISLGDWLPAQGHHELVAGMGSMYFSQLAKPGPILSSPLQTGFINWTEANVLGGSPTVMFHSIVHLSTNPHNDGQDWSLLVRERMATDKVTPLGALLEMNTSMMLQPHYAEAWTLVELLARTPNKFGKLLLTVREGYSDLAAIDKVYGWDEKRLTKEWRGYVLTRGVRPKK